MNQRNCALILGLIFLFLGIAGFVPSFVSVPPYGTEANISLNADLAYTKGFGYLFGLFPTNLMHNLVHLTVGIFGVAASSSESGARTYNRVFAVAYLAIALMGLIPLTKTTFGTMPIFGNNVWFNALTGILAGYFGFLKPKETTQISV